jgi:hypothetical protein
MKDSATKGFEQAYNVQASVDSTAQVIVAALVTQQANDKRQLKPMVEKVQANCRRLPEKVSADAGYCNTKQLTEVRRSGVDLYVSPHRQKHGWVAEDKRCCDCGSGGWRGGRADAGEVEDGGRAGPVPVAQGDCGAGVGQIKEGRGFRRFAFRGLAKVSAEWHSFA